MRIGSGGCGSVGVCGRGERGARLHIAAAAQHCTAQLSSGGRERAREHSSTHRRPALVHTAPIHTSTQPTQPHSTCTSHPAPPCSTLLHLIHTARSRPIEAVVSCGVRSAREVVCVSLRGKRRMSAAAAGVGVAAAAASRTCGQLMRRTAAASYAGWGQPLAHSATSCTPFSSCSSPPSCPLPLPVSRPPPSPCALAFPSVCSTACIVGGRWLHSSVSPFQASQSSPVVDRRPHSAAFSTSTPLPSASFLSFLRCSRAATLPSAASLSLPGSAKRGCVVGVSSCPLPCFIGGVRSLHVPRRVRGVGPRPDQPSRRQRQLQSQRRRLQLSQRLSPHLPLHSPVAPSPPALLSLPARPLSHDLVPYTATAVPTSLPIFDLSTGLETGASAALPPFLFQAPVRLDVLHRVVEWQRAGARQGTAKTKDRAEVSGTGKKPHPQKGTGRARMGTRRAPHHRGGGVAHGKTPRSFATKLNKKVQHSSATHTQTDATQALHLDRSRSKAGLCVLCVRVQVRALGLRVALTVKHAQGRLRIIQRAGQQPDKPHHRPHHTASSPHTMSCRC